MKHIGTVLLLVAVVCVALGPWTLAAPKAEERLNFQWEHYTIEFAAGTFAGFAGGILAYWLVYSSQARVSSMAPMAGWFSIPIGSLIGAGAGVIGTGWALGDNVNVVNTLFTVLGAAVGAYVGFYGNIAVPLLPRIFLHMFGSEELAMVISTALATAAPAALGGAIGYNLSLPWNARTRQ